MDVEMTGKTIEDTKFLGGDLEHTHLVKGLDYALLNKVKHINLVLYFVWFGGWNFRNEQKSKKLK